MKAFQDFLLILCVAMLFQCCQSDPNTKLKLYSNVNTQFPFGGFAFNTGYVYYALDSDTYLHESVHTIQFLTGLDNLSNLLPVFISKNRSPISTLSELNEWRNYAANENS